MPICTLDERDFCERHKTIHVGRLKELALMDTELGEQYRQLWDATPSANGDAAVHTPPVLCPFIGPEIEENGAVKTKDCEGCRRGNVRLKVFRCNHPAREPEEVTFSDCRTCAYKPQENVAAEKIILRCGNDKHVLCPGDALVMSAAIHSLHKAYPGKYLTAVDTSANQLYEFNPDIWQPSDEEKAKARVIHAEYPAINRCHFDGKDYGLGCNQRAITFMEAYCEGLSQSLGVSVPLLTNRPHVYLSYREKTWLNQVQEVTQKPTKFWVVNAGHKSDYSAKWYGFSQYQKVVDLLRGKIQFVQIGSAEHNHQPLRGVIDLRGKTDHRQFVRLCWHADGGLGGVTYLQHLMASLEKPYMCILGGREPVNWNSYPKQHTFHTMGLLACCRNAACWRSRTVALNDGSEQDKSLCEQPLFLGDETVPRCMGMIRPEEVAEKISGFSA